MFARLHAIDVTREQHEEGLQIVRDQFLPWARESSGFRGLIGLVDEAHEQALVLTLWSDRAALDASAQAGDELSRLAAEVTGSTRRSLESYEVTVFDVPG
jgi:heme-degrading monooxygenase HmoA